MTARAQLEDAKHFTLNPALKASVPARVYDASPSKQTTYLKLTENYLQSNANVILAEVERLKILLTKKSPKKSKLDSVKNDGMLAMQDDDKASANNSSSHNGANSSTDKLGIPAEFASKSPGYGPSSPRMFSFGLPDADSQEPANGNALSFLRRPDLPE